MGVDLFVETYFLGSDAWKFNLRQISAAHMWRELGLKSKFLSSSQDGSDLILNLFLKNNKTTSFRANP